ncbi:MAG: hypothetical protein LCH53_02305 [Bacteroidetes bacterium]|nr:hypothetical protein [Bacteroidota bacterium]
MGKACLIVKSPNAATYQTAITHATSRVGKLEHVEVVFFQTPRIPEVIGSVSNSAEYTIGIRDVSDAEDLKDIMNEVDVCDVSGLPKEDFAEVLAVAIGRRNIALCTLTRDVDHPYLDLMATRSLKSFNRSYLAQVGFNRAVIAVGACAVGALLLLKLIEFVPNAETWATWLGIGIGMLGLLLSWRSLKYT